MNVSDVLLAARDIVRERGWTSGQGHDPATGGVCIETAVEIARETQPGLSPMFRLSHYCQRRYGVRHAHLANDENIKDIDEACDVLEQAAKWEEGDNHYDYDPFEGNREF